MNEVGVLFPEAGNHAGASTYLKLIGKIELIKNVDDLKIDLQSNFHASNTT